MIHLIKLISSFCCYAWYHQHILLLRWSANELFWGSWFGLECQSVLFTWVPASPYFWQYTYNNIPVPLLKHLLPFTFVGQSGNVCLYSAYFMTKECLQESTMVEHGQAQSLEGFFHLHFFSVSIFWFTRSCIFIMSQDKFEHFTGFYIQWILFVAMLHITKLTFCAFFISTNQGAFSPSVW